MCIILLSTASSIIRVQTPQKHPHNALLFNRWSGSNCALFPGASPPGAFPGTFSRRLHIFRRAVHGELIVKAQMPVASGATGICRIIYAVYFAAKISRIRFAASEGVLPTFTPAASRASFFA